MCFVHLTSLDSVQKLQHNTGCASSSAGVCLHMCVQVLLLAWFLIWKISYSFCREQIILPGCGGERRETILVPQQVLMEIVFLCQMITENILKERLWGKCCNSLAFCALLNFSGGWKLVSFRFTAAILFYSLVKPLFQGFAVLPS